MAKLLVCELHAHSTWSDGFLTLPELVHMHGNAGIDVLCVTDHAVRLDDPTPNAVDPWTWPSYSAAIRSDAAESMPAVAMGDVHRPEHLASWKTLIPCDRDPMAVITYLRSAGRVLLSPFAQDQAAELQKAA